MADAVTKDVVVVGAGIMGASCAYHLAKRGHDVMVVEREQGHAMGSSGKSAAGVRVQFTTAHNISLSMASLPVYRSFAEEHGLEVGYDPIGYLLLVPEAMWETHLESVELQRSMGAPVEVVTAEEANRWVPVNPEGLGGATFGPWDGVVDPHMATGAWVELGRRAGVEFRFRTEVLGVERHGPAWRVTTNAGTVEAPWVVNAAGAWAGQLGRMAGLNVPVVPKKVQIHLSAPVQDPRTYPLTIDLGTGVYLRSEGNRVLFGKDNRDQEIGFHEGMNWPWMEQVLMTGLDRFPWFEDLGIDRSGSWWGYYEVTPDNSPIIGCNPDADGWIEACGFSGHGIMHAPATGAAVAALVSGSQPEVDLAPFRHGRFGEGAVAEANVF